MQTTVAAVAVFAALTSSLTAQRATKRVFVEVVDEEDQPVTGLTAADVRLLPPAPFDLDVHAIPAGNGEPAHQHHDVRFLFEWLRSGLPAGENMRWAAAEELAASTDEGLRRVGLKLAAR